MDNEGTITSEILCLVTGLCHQCHTIEYVPET